MVVQNQQLHAHLCTALSDYTCKLRARLGNLPGPQVKQVYLWASCGMFCDKSVLIQTVCWDPTWYGACSFLSKAVGALGLAWVTV